MLKGKKLNDDCLDKISGGNSNGFHESSDYTIDISNCVNCGKFKEECPCDCITDLGYGLLVSWDCVACGVCEGACPTGAIHRK